MKKVALGIFILLTIAQVVFIVLKTSGVWNMPVLWLISPLIVGFVLGTLFIVSYVLRAEKEENCR